MPKLILQGTNYEIRPAIKKYLENELADLHRFSPKILEARAELAFDQTVKEGRPFRAEINLRIGGKILRAVNTGTSIFEAIDLMLKTIKQELIKFKEKMSR